MFKLICFSCLQISYEHSKSNCMQHTKTIFLLIKKSNSTTKKLFQIDEYYIISSLYCRTSVGLHLKD